MKSDFVDLTLSSSSELHPPTVAQPQNDQMRGRDLLSTYLNKPLRICMSDGRVLVGVFLCTDQQGNTIIGNCVEHLPASAEKSTSSYDCEPRSVGVVMVPGSHIVSVHVDLLQHPPDSHIT